ncbi:hypothetical protein FOMPIDRAFT_1133206 [Fomitopsis schrenkii]|uniref:Uncharacterized protein n=1 Tax=Fomitopsis schrenkii TaxID=2126942 RepID=S8F8G5_FOMSC|nr:hypothetical protein FOMPIDRAFT_1133206 [Fomitopsis schrenkii]
MWDGPSPGPPPVSMDAMCRPVDEGGLGLLDLRARNQAIELVWLRRYLTLSDKRPMWAYAVDVLFSLYATKDAGAIQHPAQINTFLQSWSPAIHHASPLPEYLKRMMANAKKHRVSFEAIKLDKASKDALPIWYHLGAVRKLRRLNNSPTSRCLRDNHGVVLVADLARVTRRECHAEARAAANDYLPDACDCAECTQDRANGCGHPLKCCHMADNLLAQIQPKWHPASPGPHDGLTHTPR